MSNVKRLSLVIMKKYYILHIKPHVLGLCTDKAVINRKWKARFS